MKVRAIDAVDSMGLGGYIDRDTGKYIPPQWYIERFEEMKGSYSASDYQRFENNPDRYLKPPIFHRVGNKYVVALSMGITEEQLKKWGMKEEYKKDFYERVPFDYNRTDLYQATDEEWAISKAIRSYFFNNGRYNEYDRKHHERLIYVMKKWMHEHGIEIIE